MIADNKEWEKMFGAKKGVHFLDLEDRSKPQHGRVGQRRIISRRKFDFKHLIISNPCL